MFSSFITFKRARYTSGASYRRYTLSTAIFPIAILSPFSYGKKGMRGRTKGSITCRTKGSTRKTSRSLSSVNQFSLCSLGFIGDVSWSFYPYKFFSYVIMTSGLTTISYTTTEHTPFSLFHPLLLCKIFGTKLPRFFSSLFSFKRMSRVSAFASSSLKGIQYVRALGTWSLYQALDNRTYQATLKLPSGGVKLLSAYTVVSHGGIFKTSIKRFANTKAGFYKLFGKKSLSRGVAKNPVDHPHGGRSKAIKNPRSPWGFPTRSK